MSTHSEIRADKQREAEEHGRRSGYATGGMISEAQDAKQDKKIADREVKKGIRQHDEQEHPGHHTSLRLKRGGHIDGKKPAERADRVSRARGGRAEHGGGKHVTNIVIGNPAERQQAAMQGMKMGAAMGARQMAGGMAGPVGPGGPGGPPGGGPGLPIQGPPGAMAFGGGVKDAGAGSGMGRLEQAGEEDLVHVPAHTRRKAGGRCD